MDMCLATAACHALICAPTTAVHLHVARGGGLGHGSTLERELDCGAAGRELPVHGAHPHHRKVRQKGGKQHVQTRKWMESLVLHVPTWEFSF